MTLMTQDKIIKLVQIAHLRSLDAQSPYNKVYTPHLVQLM